MTRIFGGVRCSNIPLVLMACASLAGLTIATGLSGGDIAAAQQAKPKTATTQRFNFAADKGSQRKQKSKPKKSKTKTAARRKLPIPKPETLLALVRLYLVGLDQAIKANDFRVLHAISAPALRSKMTADQLAAAFADLRKRRVDLAAAVILTPQITESPKMLQGNILDIVGYIPTRPQRTNFHMQFQPANRQWKLRGMRVTTKPVKRTKPKTAAPAKSPTKKKKNSATKK